MNQFAAFIVASNMSNYTIEQLVSVLSKASHAYYNGGKEVLTDEAYDALRDELEMRDPSNTFLRSIGAPVEKGAVRLPYKMPSLTKIKPGGAVGQFASSCKSKSWVLSDKLDGISVLWVADKKQLFLRGDGLMGVNISQYAPFIQGLCVSNGTPLVVRGELITKEGDLPAGTLGRSWVNGLVHHKTVRADDARKLRFVAYQILVPGSLTRLTQMNELKRMGFEVPYYCLTDTITDEFLADLLKERRAKSPYSIDGIVVGEDSVPISENGGDDVVNPRDMRAFKMPLADQQATTRVVDVLWSASYQGYWIPRIQIEPVQIGGSRIEFLTGHNARFVLDNKISKGAVIVVRKSGDVIPTLDHLVSAGSEAPKLPNGIWDGAADTAKHLKLVETATDQHDDVIQKRLEHFATALDIPYLGPGLVAKLITAGIKTPGALVRLTRAGMSAAIGSGMTEKIYPALQAAFTNISEMNLMIGSGTMPRGVGDKKLRALFSISSDPRQWSSIKECEGWSRSALQDFVRGLSSYETWRQREFPSLTYPISKTEAPIPVTRPSSGKSEVICFTGFRSTDLETRLKQRGHELSDSITKKTSILVVPDATAITSPSGKVTKAIALKSVKIMTRDQFEKEYLA